MKIRKSELKIIYDLMIVDGVADDKQEAVMYWQSLSGRDRKPFIRRMKEVLRERALD